MPFLLRPDPLEEFTTLTESAFPKVIIMLYGRLVYVGEALTNLQILGCELQTKCVWPPGSASTRWERYSAFPDPLTVIRGSGG